MDSAVSHGAVSHGTLSYSAVSYCDASRRRLFLSFFLLKSVLLSLLSQHVLRLLVCAHIGNMLFHGPREEVVPFFQSQGFYVPERKAVSDFLQEVTSKKG